MGREAAGRVLRLLRWKGRHRRPAAMQEGWWDNRGGNASWGRCNALDGRWWGDQAWNDSALNIHFDIGEGSEMAYRREQHRGPSAM